MFDTILIANRGEIACRVARTARRLGVRSVAIYSDADVDALHVAACDEAWRVGPPPARESYLDGAAIIAIARRAGAQAIHPGYGFLSENAGFARACADAGIAFIGPPPAAIAAMGSKSEAKRLMQAAGVPVVPGYHGDDQDDAHLAREAEAIGFPVLIKASAGGGGKGMRVVERAADFAAALASARREAKSGFGDDRVLLEKYLTAPRHIEMQVFADTHGHAVHLFERDCSVQRRHQKVLEEAPAPGVTAGQRASMGAAAVAAAQAIGYVGAGTVEFIAPATFAADGAFYFMEMNTRLQVEHPVTEMITGIDLVEWQLRVAAGEPLPEAQSALAIRGHAIEARIYAEDPAREFLPSIGTITHWRVPADHAGVRVDTGFAAGKVVSPFYDPMLAKLIVHAVDRAAAVAKLADALRGCEIAGVATNVAFLRRILAEGTFSRGEVDTGLIARHLEALVPMARPTPAAALIALGLAELKGLREARAREAANRADPHSPWERVDGWWLNSRRRGVVFEFRSGDGVQRVLLARDRNQDADVDRWTASLPGHDDVAVVLLSVEAEGLGFAIEGVRHRAVVVAHGDERHVFCDGDEYRLTRVDPLDQLAEHEAPEGHLRAPMSGTVVAVLVAPGTAVARGAALMVLEAMKMEHTITAPAAGTVSAVHFAVGERVQEGADLVDVDVDAP
ncbi:MAG: acetyl-CoA carboxylase biotin carboxylase subunit [Casimicrobiaceae bacterium]